MTQQHNMADCAAVFAAFAITLDKHFPGFADDFEWTCEALFREMSEKLREGNKDAIDALADTSYALRAIKTARLNGDWGESVRYGPDGAGT